jgi:hypothetical protein
LPEGSPIDTGSRLRATHPKISMRQAIALFSHFIAQLGKVARTPMMPQVRHIR